MKAKKELPEDLRPHCIYLLSYCPIMICITKEVAENTARRLYPEGTYRVRLATTEDIKCVCEV